MDGETLAGIRMRGAGAMAAIPEPFDGLCKAIAVGGSSVTDTQIAAVRAKTGSEKGAFEVVFAASVGAGLARWDAASRAIDGVGDAPR